MPSLKWRVVAGRVVTGATATKKDLENGSGTGNEWWHTVRNNAVSPHSGLVAPVCPCMQALTWPAALWLGRAKDGTTLGFSDWTNAI